MEQGIDYSITAIEGRVVDTIEKASKLVQSKLVPAHALIHEIKKAMSKGVECITTLQLQEWAIAVPILIEELVPIREAHSLTKTLWDIETKQLSASNLLELDKKKVEIENINKLAGTENAKKSAIAEYIRSSIGSVQESLWVLGNAIRKIIDARIASGDRD